MSRHVSHIPRDRGRNSVVPDRAAPRRCQYRQRDFGIGYGRSSGYGDSRRYTSDWGAPRFRCG